MPTIEMPPPPEPEPQVLPDSGDASDKELIKELLDETPEENISTDIVEVEELSEKVIRAKVIESKINEEAKRRLQIEIDNGVKIRSEKGYLEKIKQSISKREIEAQLNIDELIEESFDDINDFQDYLKDLSTWYTQYVKSDLNILLRFKEYTLIDAFTGRVKIESALDIIDLIEKFEEYHNEE